MPRSARLARSHWGTETDPRDHYTSNSEYLTQLAIAYPEAFDEGVRARRITEDPLVEWARQMIRRRQIMDPR